MVLLRLDQYFCFEIVCAEYGASHKYVEQNESSVSRVISEILSQSEAKIYFINLCVYETCQQLKQQFLNSNILT